MNYFSDNPELKWLFRHGFDWDNILPLYYKSFPTEEGFANKEEAIDFLRETLSAVGQWCSEKVAPRAKQLDQEGAGKIVGGETVLSPSLAQTYKEAKDLAFYSLSTPKTYGGLGTPGVAITLSHMMISRACLATSCQLNFFHAFVDMVDRFCAEEDIKEYLPKLIAGEISGSMALTEPGAGSDLGAMRTSATPGPNGNFILNGSKCFISNPGGGFSFVLGRIKGAPEGIAGISMFLVPLHIERDGKKVLNYHIAKNEEKLGLHGSFTCEVVFENSWGKLLGEANKGFTYMLHLMNQSRMGVGLQCVGGMEACLAYVEEYAQQRKAFGKTLLELPLYKKNFQSWKIELDAIRALVVDSMSYFELYATLGLKQAKTGDLSQKEVDLFKEAKRMMRLRTPLVKYYSSEAYVELSKRAMQALGSYGYMKDYEAERLHRDSFGPLMYEGTSQVQALMVLKDTLKSMTANPKKYLVEMLSSLAQQRPLRYKFQRRLGGLLLRTLSPPRLKTILSKSALLDEGKISALMTHAETITQALSYIETAEVLQKHAQKDPSRDALYENYLKLIQPRLGAIYETWRQEAYV